MQGTRPAKEQPSNMLQLSGVLSLSGQVQRHSGAFLWCDSLRGEDQSTQCKVRSIFYFNKQHNQGSF